jgi:hypothetical protein
MRIADNSEMNARQRKGFALVGAHAIADCGACHIDQMPREFAGTSTECAACHGGDFQSTTNPGHEAAGFSQECESCHGRSALTWATSTYVHPAIFPLTGGHSNASCDNCHATAYAGTSTDCVACHEADFNDAPDPDHVSAGFSTQCIECHYGGMDAGELDHTRRHFR